MMRSLVGIGTRAPNAAEHGRSRAINLISRPRARASRSQSSCASTGELMLKSLNTPRHRRRSSCWFTVPSYGGGSAVILRTGCVKFSSLDVRPHCASPAVLRAARSTALQRVRNTDSTERVAYLNRLFRKPYEFPGPETLDHGSKQRC